MKVRTDSSEEQTPLGVHDFAVYRRVRSHSSNETIQSPIRLYNE